MQSSRRPRARGRARSEQDLEQIRRFRSDADRGRRRRTLDGVGSGFHVAVARASHNPFLSTLLAPLVKVIEQVIGESFRSRQAVRAGLGAHEYILERIEGRDSPGAELAMREHLADSQQRLTAVRIRGARGQGR